MRKEFVNYSAELFQTNSCLGMLYQGYLSDYLGSVILRTTRLTILAIQYVISWLCEMKDNQAVTNLLLSDEIYIESKEPILKVLDLIQQMHWLLQIRIRHVDTIWQVGDDI